VVVADSSWSVVPGRDDRVGRGAHGFDNANTDMHAIFYACGPAFRKGHVAPTFENVDIYPLICLILDLEPAEMDGDVRHVENMLENSR
jgi:alkaline phosphatase D